MPNKKKSGFFKSLKKILAVPKDAVVDACASAAVFAEDSVKSARKSVRRTVRSIRENSHYTDGTQILDLSGHVKEQKQREYDEALKLEKLAEKEQQRERTKAGHRELRAHGRIFQDKQTIKDQPFKISSWLNSIENVIGKKLPFRAVKEVKLPHQSKVSEEFLVTDVITKKISTFSEKFSDISADNAAQLLRAYSEMKYADQRKNENFERFDEARSYIRNSWNPLAAEYDLLADVSYDVVRKAAEVDVIVHNNEVARAAEHRKRGGKYIPLESVSCQLKPQMVIRSFEDFEINGESGEKKARQLASMISSFYTNLPFKTKGFDDDGKTLNGYLRKYRVSQVACFPASPTISGKPLEAPKPVIAIKPEPVVAPPWIKYDDRNEGKQVPLVVSVENFNIAALPVEPISPSLQRLFDFANQMGWGLERFSDKIILESSSEEISRGRAAVLDAIIKKGYSKDVEMKIDRELIFVSAKQETPEPSVQIM